MKRKIIYAKEDIDFDTVAGCFDLDWILDPQIYDGKPCRLENAVVYHLVKYTEEELEALANQQVEAEPTLVSIIKVSYDQADEKLKDGYVVTAKYAKEVVMEKYEEKQDGHIVSLGAGSTDE